MGPPGRFWALAVYPLGVSKAVTAVTRSVTLALR
jgi:hypothetical protein